MQKTQHTHQTRIDMVLKEDTRSKS